MDATRQKRELKERAIDEAKNFVAFVGYLWVVISLFDIHKLVVLRAQHINSPLGFKLGLNLVNALVLGKILLIGDSLHMGEQLKDQALIYRLLFRSAIFAVLLVCFDIFEEVAIGMFHGRTMAQSIPEWGGGGLEGKALVSIMAFVILIPLFAFVEIRRVLGDAEFHSLVFENQPKSGAAKPGTR